MAASSVRGAGAGAARRNELPLRRLTLAALAVLVVASLAVRLWMGSTELHAGRFWDERYALENVAALLEERGALPANAYHPALAHLPQAALLAAARATCEHTPLCDDRILQGGRFTPLAYLLARWLQAVFGALSLVALYRVGRRLFGPAEGLAAAALLAMVPWHVRQSAIFKPDILLLLLVVVACEAALAVAERPTLRRHLVAGLTVGLATAAKYNGFTAGLFLFVGALADLGRAPRRLLLLAAAAAAAIVVFLALDPHLVTDPWMLRRDFGGTLRDYAHKGAAAGASAAGILLHAPATLLSAPFHGPLVGAAGLAGLGLLGAGALRRGVPRAQREGRLMLLGFPLLYAVLYAAATNNPSPHNWLPLAPFTALGAAWLGVRACELAAARLPARLPARVRRPAAAAALALLVALSPLVAFRYAYPATVPTTLALAEGYLLGELPRDLADRLVLYEPGDGGRLVVKVSARRKATIVPLPPGDEAAARTLAGADAAVLEHRTAWRLGLFDAGAVDRLRSFRPGFLRAWGRPLVAAVAPWCRVGDPQALAGEGGVYQVPAPPAPEAVRVSFAVVTTPGHDGRHVAPLVLAGRPVELFWNRDAGGGQRLVSERVEAPPGAGPWPLAAARATPAAVRDVRAVWWRPPDDDGCGGGG